MYKIPPPLFWERQAAQWWSLTVAYSVSYSGAPADTWGQAGVGKQCHLLKAGMSHL